jgi:hypothetical protein
VVEFHGDRDGGVQDGQREERAAGGQGVEQQQGGALTEQESPEERPSSRAGAARPAFGGVVIEDSWRFRHDLRVFNPRQGFRSPGTTGFRSPGTAPAIV